MPEEIIASAERSISRALTLQPKAFQSLKPIGGVRATPLSKAAAEPAQQASAAAASAATATNRIPMKTSSGR